MIDALLAALLLVQPSGAPSPANGVDSAEPAQGETRDPQEDDASEESADSDDEAEEPEPMVCRQVHVYDDFGRLRVRRSCRPRDE